ncbi:transcriptional protein SWT1-like [Dendronephthya gigantea]|uniref:transcriptional protein SWT1-like n=1 Tax=Dendronephthya gigantea TaxID=151771 RepID=UPI0010693F8B|nr:transcriptional protein SWT1-like [Dendronephthya gigantea]
MSEKDLKEAQKDLPKDWKVFHSTKSKRFYYYNNVTKKTQWQHPCRGEKNRDDGKLKCKKRKPATDEQTNLKYDKIKQSYKTTHDLTNIKKEIIPNTESSQKSIPSQRFYLKPSPSGSRPKLHTCNQEAKGSPQLQVTKPFEKTDKTDESTRCNETGRKGSQTTKIGNDSAKGNIKTPTTANQNFKTNPQVTTSVKEQKVPVLVKSKSQNEAQLKTKHQPLSRTKSLGEGSDSGVSDSSDRILAWLADTSRIDFKDHPIPNNPPVVNKEISKDKLDNIAQNQTVSGKQTSAVNTGKEKSEKCKVAILGCSKTSKQEKNAILDKSPPKTHGKQRFTPYKLKLPNIKHKTESSSQAEQRRLSGGTEGKANSDATPNQNYLLPKLANCVARNFGGKATPGLLVPGDSEDATITENLFIGDNTDVNRFSVQTVSNSSGKISSPKTHQLTRPSGVVSSVQQDEVLPMEEEVRNDVSVSLSEDGVADMEIDNVEEFAKEIVQELKEMRGIVVVHPSRKPKGKDQMAMNVSSDGYEGSLYIVLDTNVLLSHLKFVVELKDYPIPGVGRPTLVIPWIVMQELDSLKENKWRSHDSGDKATRVDLLARNAIKMLNSLFQKSDPRVRGQTVEEAAEHVGSLQEETNDDRILQCCLLFHQRAQNGSCVLFSNDINLCNKAMVNGIKAFKHEKLLPGLKALFQCGVMVKQNSGEYKIQLAIEEDQARRRQKADDILCELQIILREGVSYIIENEMKSAYDDLWMEIVHIKPPWTLIDVLQLLDKHWIAVFGHILKRDKKELIHKLRQKFDDRKGTASSLKFCSDMLQLALQLFQSFAYHSNYGDAMPKCLAAVNVLVKKCQQFEASMSSSFGSEQAKCLTYPSTSKVVNNSSSTVVEEDATMGNNTGQPHEDVLHTFNLIWAAVTQFSTQIFTALGYPNTITDEAPQDYPKASKVEAIAFLRTLCPKLLNLVHSIQNVLRDPWDKVSQNNNLFIQLEQAITVFLKEVLSQENSATAEKLFNFCEDASMRTSFIQGLSQLDRASAMLQHCASCVAQSSTM